MMAFEEPDPEMIARMEYFRRRDVRQQIRDRRQVLRFAAVICGCRAWYDPGDFSPPQSGCPVHQAVLISPDGRFWL